MRSRTRARPVLPAIVAAALLLALAAPAQAGDIKTGRIDIEARLDPADLGPGQSGTLVIEATLLPKLHIYATGEQAIAHEFVEAEGVTYGEPAYSAHHLWKDEMGDEYDVWEGTFTVKTKVTLSGDVAPGTKVGMRFTYFGCNDRGCYPPVKNHEATAVVGGSGSGGGTDKGDGAGLLDKKPPAPANPNVAADAAPTLVNAPLKSGGSVDLKIDEKRGLLAVIFRPDFDFHFYGPDDTGGNIQVKVTPVEAEGVTWGKPKYPPAVKIKDPYIVVVPFERADGVKEIAVRARYQGCTPTTCKDPQEPTLRVTWGGGAEAPPDDPEPAPEAPKGDILFPVVEDDELGKGEDDSSILTRLLQDSPLLGFGFIFLIGLGLAFTPCVLPILPITVSVISGGNPDIPPKRLAALLGTYVFGLCMTFATMGVIAAMTGGAMSALFAMKGVQWGFVVVFLLLSFAMYGLYELQPPQFLMKLQGGAQKRSGSFLGAFFFGCLGAIIASPCTGPAIAVLLIETAKAGSIAYGFILFFTLGLGMGAVLFAAGSLNFLMRPGPWMVWVRHVFGILMVGVALYYLGNYDLVGETVRWIIGAVVCVLVVVGLIWHRTKKEGEELGAARLHALKVGALTALAVVFVAWYTKAPDDLLSWTYAKDRQHLQELVAKSMKQGKPVVVDFWGDWCTNCKVYDKRIASTPSLRERFERITRVKVDLSEDYVRWPMRHALGIEESGAPVMVFIDRRGRIRRKADVVGLLENEVLAKHIDVVLEDKKPVATSSAKSK